MPSPIVRHDAPWRFDVGGTLITGTDTKAGSFRGLAALTDCTFAAGTVSTNISGTWTGLQVAAGTTIHGGFTAIQLSTGSAVAYR